jgi:hypothetical protein
MNNKRKKLKKAKALFRQHVALERERRLVCIDECHIEHLSRDDVFISMIEELQSEILDKACDLGYWFDDHIIFGLSLQRSKGARNLSGSREADFVYFATDRDLEWRNISESDIENGIWRQKVKSRKRID